MEPIDVTQTQSHLMSVAEMARRLRVSRAYAYKLIDRGSIPAIRLGTTIRVRSDVVERIEREGIA